MRSSNDAGRGLRRASRGKLILFEGIDGSGKTVQSKLLLAALAQKNITATIIHHPDYNQPIGQLIRSYLENHLDFPASTVFQLFTADQIKDAKRIQDLLEGGSWVIKDRSLPSAVAYQSAQGFSNAKKIAALLPHPRPDLVLFLDIPADVAVRRKVADRPDRLEVNEKLLAMVAKNYQSLARAKFLGKWLRLDGTKSKEEIAQEIRAALKL